MEGTRCECTKCWLIFILLARFKGTGRLGERLLRLGTSASLHVRRSFGDCSPMTLPVPDLIAFRREVAGRFGLVPNFFVSAPDAPEIIERLWDFAKAAYLDSPIPPLFKERLFVYLWRFCQVRYCITRHCAFLLGYGHSSGAPAAPR